MTQIHMQFSKFDMFT